MLPIATMPRSLSLAKAAAVVAFSFPGFVLAQSSSVPSGNRAQKHGFFAAENLTVIKEKHSAE
jgi:hypothetical protein